MTIRGKVIKGKVLLDDPAALADGTEVEVRPVKKRKTSRKTRKAPIKKQQRSLAERLRPFIGSVKDLPSDMSVNLNHYLYGHPKEP